jgi:hypothetical protein
MASPLCSNPRPSANNGDVWLAESDQFRVLLGSSSLSFLHFLVVNSFTMRVTSDPNTFLLRQVHVVVRLGHGLDQLLALDLEPRLTNCLAPRPFDPAAEHLGDVGFVPSLDDIAGDVSPCGSLVAMMSQILTLHALRASRSARSSGVPSGSFASNASDAVSGELGGLPASSAKAAWLKQRERHATAAVRAKFMEPSPKGRWSMVSRMRHGDALDFWPVHARFLLSAHISAP